MHLNLKNSKCGIILMKNEEIKLQKGRGIFYYGAVHSGLSNICIYKSVCYLQYELPPKLIVNKQYRYFSPSNVRN
jgi:hypothetical protein